MLLRTVFCSLLLGVVSSELLSRCRLARDLREAGIRYSLIPHWVCLAEAESGLNTSLRFGPYPGGYFRHGIFQIPSNNWCEVGRRGKKCNAKCEDLEGDNIVESIMCAIEIFAKHGFQAWEGWNAKCRGKPLPNILHCLRN
nr:lysozyme-like protein 3 [Coridius chinensis]